MLRFRSSSLLVALSVAACGGSPTVTPPPPPPTPTVDHIVIDNGDFTLDVGATRQLQVRPLSAAGELVTTATVSYTTSDATVATVGSSGVVMAIAPGVATITATASGKSATVKVTVQLVPVASISIELQRQVIKTNDTTRIVATLRDADNNILAGRVINWQSSDSSIVLIGPTGIVLGLRTGGPVTLSASIQGRSASVTITVTPALVALVRVIPDTTIIAPDSAIQMRVEVTDEFGGIVDGSGAIWASVAAQIARVSTTGLVTGVQVGETRILATVGGVTGESVVKVSVPGTERFLLSVDNRLQFPLSVIQNGVPIGLANANSISTFERPMTERAVFGWVLVRPSGRGEPMSEYLPEILNPTGTILMTATNILADGRVYFTPVLRSFNGEKNLINFPIVESATPCLCAISSEDAFSRDYGYWRLLPESVLEIFGFLDSSMTGPKIVVPILAEEVEPITGIWRYNLFITP